jgi:hypothetical protein
MADLAAHEARLKTLQWLDSSKQDRAQFKQLARNQNIYFIGVMNRENMLEELAQY